MGMCVWGGDAVVAWGECVCVCGGVMLWVCVGCVGKSTGTSQCVHVVHLFPSATQQHIRVANELLLWLVTIVSGNASQGVLNEIQQQLAQCESHGGANSAIPKGEDLAGFASTLSTCRKLEDVDKKLRPVLTG